MIIATVHLDQINHKTEGGAQPKGYENGVWKKKPTNIEEEVYRGNFRIFKKLLGVEKLCMV